MPDLIPDDLPNAAEKHAARRTLPNRFVRVTVGTSPVTIDLSALEHEASGTGPTITDPEGNNVTEAVDATARYVWAKAPKASPGDVTALRGTHASLEAGRGVVLEPGGMVEEVYSPGGEAEDAGTVVTLVASAADSFVDLLWDDEL